MARRKALVTLAIGERYVADFVRDARAGWQAYADRHGYDLYVLTEPIDAKATRALHWQKLLVGLVPGIRDYDHVVWLDSDVIINPHIAPCVVSQVDGDRIAVAETWDLITPTETMGRRFAQCSVWFNTQVGAKRGPYDLTPRFDPAAPLTPDNQRPINTGLFVFRPAAHNAFLSEVYLKGYHNADDGSFEQKWLSYEFQAQDVVTYIDRRFNMTWGEYAALHYPFLFDQAFVSAHPRVAAQCVNTYYHNTFFSHFAGYRAHSITKGLLKVVSQDKEHVLQYLAPDFWRDRHAIFRGFDRG